ncbi:hypothetical protein B0G84_8455 [Paraburkholderia sp. BL8N3]|nr:hypothetical protein B0G84_8455 [Paraburkholderia sp. BL8N3]
MEPSAESEQNPAVARKTPPYDGFTMHEYGQPSLSRRGCLLVKCMKRKKLLNVLNGGHVYGQDLWTHAQR